MLRPSGRVLRVTMRVAIAIALAAATVPIFGQVGSTPPERRMTPTSLSESMRDFDYVDDLVTRSINLAPEIEPSERVFQWLRGQKLRCISQRTVSWRGKNGATEPERGDGEFRIVVECRKNCSGLKYHLNYRGYAWHWGRSQPLPVLQIKPIVWGAATVNLTFVRPDAAITPEVLVTQWAGGGWNGAGCRLFD